MNLTSILFDEVDAEHLFFVSKMLNKKQKDKIKTEMIITSYNAWQQLPEVNSKHNFGSYIKKLGLVEVEKISKEEKLKIEEKVKTVADRIMKMDKK